MKKAVSLSIFSRIEGDINVKLDIENGYVIDAFMSGTPLLQFDKILGSHSPMDAVGIICRMCGACGVAHSATASAALAQAFGISPPPNGVLCCNIIQGIEIILNHLNHFYLSFLPDIIDTTDNSIDTCRFLSMSGKSFRQMLQARSRFLALLGLMAGKWPNTLAIQPGGTTKILNSSELSRGIGILAEFTGYLRDVMFGCPLDEWLAIKSCHDLDLWLEDRQHEQSDVGVFLTVARKIGLEKIGNGPRRFLSEGGFPYPDGKTLWIKSGYFDDSYHNLDTKNIEDYLRILRQANEESDGMGAANLAIEDERSSLRLRYPRYHGQSVEVGPLARMLINGDPLALDFLNHSQIGVLTRVLMRIREMAMITKQLEFWLAQITPDSPFYTKEKIHDAEALALQPAPRGILAHLVDIHNGVIRDYQILTPTAWNFSPRDADGNRGPVEESLIGTPVANDKEIKYVTHIVKSFDPCLYCYIHH